MDCTACEIELDITEAVAAWALDPVSNYGVVLKAEGPVQVRYSFASSEHSTLAWRPTLSITYTTPGGRVKGHESLVAPGILATPRPRLMGGIFE